MLKDVTDTEISTNLLGIAFMTNESLKSATNITWLCRILAAIIAEFYARFMQDCAAIASVAPVKNAVISTMYKYLYVDAVT